ncbi:Arginine repressor, partial [Haemophilus influenzae]
SHP